MASVVDDPTFRRLAWPLARLIPENRRWAMMAYLRNQPSPDVSPTRFLCDPYFGKDRLLALGRLQATYPEFSPRSLAETREYLERYAQDRFTDQALQG